MDNIISSQLFQRLIDLSDMSEYSKFLLINKDWIRWLFPLIPIGAFILADSSRKKFNIFLIISSIAIVLFIYYGYMLSFNKMDKLTLNKPQIVLLKSIQNTEFQTLIQESIRQKGANLNAIKLAINRYEDNLKTNKENIEKDENGQKGLELYNSIQIDKKL